MSSRPSSPPLGHATIVEARKPSTRTVAHRKVYGKRRTNAARAVLEDNGQIDRREGSGDAEVSVETLQAKLAKVTIHEQPAPERHVRQSDKKETPTQPTRRKTEASPTQYKEDIVSKKSTVLSKSTRDFPSADQQRRPEGYDVMVEVRVSEHETSTKSDEVKQQQRDRSAAHTNSPRKKKPSTTGRRISGLVHDTKVNAYVRPILKEALSPIASQGVQNFSSWASRSAKMFDVVKLAEGSYGEVYKLHLRDQDSRPPVSKSKLARLRAYGDGVFKVVPLCAPRGPGSKKYTSVEEIVSEVKLLKYLDPIPGFARFREIHVVQGRFPDLFQRAWDHYKETSNDCWNPDPSNRRAFPETQLWAIIEMDDAGHELEKFSWCSIFQIYDIFWGVAMALARAEEYAMFEHRDLHLGNVCIRSNRADGSMDPPTDLEVVRQRSASGFGYSSLETTIIDYSLSRADLQISDPANNVGSMVEIASSDLDKRQIFDAVGEDEDEVLLRDTYRYMRNTVYTGTPLSTEKVPDVPGIWAEYVPRTNLVWLVFLLKNLLKNRQPESAHVPALQQRTALAPRSLNRSLSSSGSTEAESVKKKTEAKSVSIKESHLKDVHARVLKLKQTLEKRLESVLDLLDLKHGHDDMCCAADLVAYAMDSKWLVEEDFF
ncbi:hypothetical protein PDE_02474 [Penicillium oxalicum 114-2]|uniref:non-specific serine/threonine protein kinase n=1 Tax=Penicillium oxalicum (strain 114-2 / CGMCC 5302) TaxID=933388 RepID=S7ZFU5_PENO1|nr:hypothetical protein PDE_02474 [Penicillium oxalicum 114-2]